MVGANEEQGAGKVGVVFSLALHLATGHVRCRSLFNLYSSPTRAR